MKPYCYICCSGPPWWLLERACQNLSDQTGPRKYARTQQSVHGEETSSPKNIFQLSEYITCVWNAVFGKKNMNMKQTFNQFDMETRHYIIIWLYKDVTVSIAQVCYQCGNIRRVFKSPEPERRPSLMPETRIWVSFRSPDHIFSLRPANLLLYCTLGCPKTLLCWILQCPLDHSCQMVNKWTTESFNFIDP